LLYCEVQYRSIFSSWKRFLDYLSNSSVLRHSDNKRRVSNTFSFCFSFTVFPVLQHIRESFYGALILLDIKAKILCYKNIFNYWREIKIILFERFLFVKKFGKIRSSNNVIVEVVVQCFAYNNFQFKYEIQVSEQNQTNGSNVTRIREK
jgi:hypothetical protein